MEYSPGVMNDNHENAVFLRVFSLYFVAKPFYLWQSGLPQISDFIFAAFALYLLLFYRVGFYKMDTRYVSLIFAFLWYITVVNLVWTVILRDLSLSVSSIWYVYNGAAAVITLFICQKYGMRAYRFIYLGASVSLIVQTLILALNYNSRGFRQVNFFNNPNQLGYYALTTLAIILVTPEECKFRELGNMGTIFGACILILASLSKACIISMILMLLLYLTYRLSRLKRPSYKKMLKGIVIGLCVVLAFAVLIPTNWEKIPKSALVQNAIVRIKDIGQDNDDNWTGRGYDRIFNDPEYLLLGAGEGRYERFQSMNNEMHSTLGNLVFSYGVPGLALFLSILYITMRKGTWYVNYPILICLLYGFTHNGIRNSFFWILISLTYAVNSSRKEHRNMSTQRIFG